MQDTTKRSFLVKTLKTEITEISGNKAETEKAEIKRKTEITEISGNNLDKDIEKEIEKDKDTEKDKEKEIEREKEKENVSFPPNFCHEIYKLYQNAGLPLPKTGEIGFMQYDMKKGFENIKRQHLSFDRFTMQDSTIQNYKKNTSVLTFWGEDFDTEKKP